jgi:hypothetical protein
VQQLFEPSLRQRRIAIAHAGCPFTTTVLGSDASSLTAWGVAL